MISLQTYKRKYFPLLIQFHPFHLRYITAFMLMRLATLNAFDNADE